MFLLVCCLTPLKGTMFDDGRIRLLSFGDRGRGGGSGFVLHDRMDFDLNGGLTDTHHISSEISRSFFPPQIQSVFGFLFLCFLLLSTFVSLPCLECPFLKEACRDFSTTSPAPTNLIRYQREHTRNPPNPPHPPKYTKSTPKLGPRILLPNDRQGDDASNPLRLFQTCQQVPFAMKVGKEKDDAHPIRVDQSGNVNHLSPVSLHPLLEQIDFEKEEN